MKKIITEVKRESEKSLFLYNVIPLQSEDFGVNNPFEKLPYELKSEDEIKYLIKGRLNVIGYKIEDNDIEIKYV